MRTVVLLVGVVFWAALMSGRSSSLSAAEPPARPPVIVDTDIGADIDDAFALALVLASPELELCGVTTVGGDAYTRAGVVCQFLDNLGYQQIPVAAAAPRRDKPELAGAYQYGLRAAQKHPLNVPAVEFLHQQLRARPGQVTLIALGELTNLAELFRRHPESKTQVKQLIVLGDAERNFRRDIQAAKVVFTSGMPLVLVPLDATATLSLRGDRLEQVLKSDTSLCRQLQALYELWGKSEPVLASPAAAAMAVDASLFDVEPTHLEIDDNGQPRQAAGKPNARVVTQVHQEEFLRWCVERIIRPTETRGVEPQSDSASRSRTPVIEWTPVGNRPMPARVHVFEDYETDIERRWWLAGMLETENVPPKGRRSCRGVLCRDFDDKMGRRGATWRAVIFNPVPGPPLGPRTRLSFRYWLRGADSLRVQIYSLSDGYHRRLLVSGLPQGRWQTADIDMTAARRPDGSGGPLSTDERIDDIQFYVEPSAELVIDDIVLYDAAATEPNGDTRRAFPQRFLFTGWFDTGKQGAEWPGKFEIVAHQPPRTWKAAQAVLASDQSKRQIRLDLRGLRPLGAQTRLKFQYRLAGANELRLKLASKQAERPVETVVRELQIDIWSETEIDLTDQLKPWQARGPATLDEVIFEAPTSAQFSIDDVLLYEP